MFSTCMILVGSLETVEFLSIIPLNMLIFLSISGMFWLYVEVVNVNDILTEYLQLYMTLYKKYKTIDDQALPILFGLYLLYLKQNVVKK